MKIKTFLIAMSVMTALSACSCGNKISPNAMGSEEGMSTVEGMNIATANLFEGKISDRVFFATDSSTLNGESHHILKEQAAILKQHRDSNVNVEGHCDERGTREYNLALGERRANAAKEFLHHEGIDSSKINTVSYGKERPAVEGHSREDWAQNRRAVTVISNN